MLAVVLGWGAVRGKVSCEQSQIPDPLEWGAGGETKRDPEKKTDRERDRDRDLEKDQDRKTDRLTSRQTQGSCKAKKHDWLAWEPEDRGKGQFHGLTPYHPSPLEGSVTHALHTGSHPAASSSQDSSRHESGSRTR